jgi:predicted PurR-regulated permease PerM
VLAFLVALRVVQDTLVYPRLIRHGMHLSTPALVLSLGTGAVVGGAGGVVLALPVAGFLSVSLRHWREYRDIERLVRATAHEVVAQQADRSEHEGQDQARREQ